MREKIITLFAVGLGAGTTLVVAVAWLAFWLQHDPTRAFRASEPGQDGRPPGLVSKGAGSEAPVIIGEQFRRGAGSPADLPGAWPRFRGAGFDNVSRESVPLLERAEGGAPRVLWSTDLGEGHAGAAVYRGAVYVMDYDEALSADALRCLSLADGREIWRRWYRVTVKRNHGMSRTVPAVTEDYVVTIGPRCQVMCVRRVTGELLWGLDMGREQGSKEPFWYTAQCPLIDGNEVILAPCGSALMLGADAATGRIKWRTPNPGSAAMSHSSIMPMTLCGRRMYVYAAVGAIVGVSAEMADRGTLLWANSDFAASVVAPMPVAVGDDRVFLTAGYGAGSIMLQIAASNGVHTARTVYRLKPSEGLACEQHTPLLHDGRLYGVLPKDGGARRKQFVCFDPANRTVWASGSEYRFGLGPFMLADGKFLIVNDDGDLTAARVNADRFEFLWQVKILEGQDTWAPLALAGGRLLLRDTRRMVCVDLRALP